MYSKWMWLGLSELCKLSLSTQAASYEHVQQHNAVHEAKSLLLATRSVCLAGKLPKAVSLEMLRIGLGLFPWFAVD
jgi:hypothetical protein